MKTLSAILLSCLPFAGLFGGYETDRGRWCAQHPAFKSASLSAFESFHKLDASNFATMCAMLDSAVQHVYYTSPTATNVPCYYGMTNDAAIHLDAAVHQDFWNQVYSYFTGMPVRVRSDGLKAYSVGSTMRNVWMEDAGWESVDDAPAFTSYISYSDVAGGADFYADFSSALVAAGYDTSAMDSVYVEEKYAGFVSDVFGGSGLTFPDVRGGDPVKGDVGKKAYNALKRLDATLFKAKVPDMKSKTSFQVCRGVATKSEIVLSLARLVDVGTEYAGGQSGHIDTVYPTAVQGEVTSMGEVDGLAESWDAYFSYENPTCGLILKLVPSTTETPVSGWVDCGSFRVTSPSAGTVSVSRMTVSSITKYTVKNVRCYAPESGYAATCSNVWTSASEWLEEQDGTAFDQNYPIYGGVVSFQTAADFLAVASYTETSLDFDGTAGDAQKYARCYSWYGAWNSITERNYYYPQLMKEVCTIDKHERYSDFGSFTLTVSLPDLSNPHTTQTYRHVFTPDDDPDNPVTGYCNDAESKFENHDAWTDADWDGDNGTLPGTEDESEDEPSGSDLDPYEVRVPATVVNNETTYMKTLHAYEHRPITIHGVWMTVPWDFIYFLP